MFCNYIYTFKQPPPALSISNATVAKGQDIGRPTLNLRGSSLRQREPAASPAGSTAPCVVAVPAMTKGGERWSRQRLSYAEPFLIIPSSPSSCQACSR